MSLNKSYESVEKQRLNGSTIDEYVSLNNRVINMQESISRNVEDLRPYLQKISEATTEQEEHRISKLFEENYNKLRSDFSAI